MKIVTIKKSSKYMNLKDFELKRVLKDITAIKETNYLCLREI